MSSKNRIENVAIVGVRYHMPPTLAPACANLSQASGRVGSHFAQELLKTGKHNVTAISREGSTATLPSGVKVVHANYDDHAALVSALRGHDFLVISLYARAPEGTHTKIVKAAVEAGIEYIMPNAYGADIHNEGLRNEDLVTGAFYKNAMEIQQMGANYIAMACGFWYEWSLALGPNTFGIDIKNRTVTFFDDGNTKINISTWAHCGRALAALLSLPVQAEGDGLALEQWKNRVFFISSFKLSQKDMLASVHRVLGTKDEDFTIKYEPTEKRVKDGREQLQKGDFTGFQKVLYSRSFYPGAMDFGDQVVHDALGLPDENLDEATKRVVEMVQSGWNPFA
jgi:hypothetical protein